MEIIIDTNFFITAIKQKIYIFDELKNILPQARIIIPLEVISELDKIKKSKNHNFREKNAAEIATFLINKENLEIRSLGEKNADAGIINYAIKNKNLIIATLDRELKLKIKQKNKNAKFLTIRQKNRIELQ